MELALRPKSLSIPPQRVTAGWHLADAGFDAFAMDMTGYGRSTRPAPMNDPCNFPSAQQESLVPALLEETCTGSYPFAMTTIASDWHDLDTVVTYLKKLRDVDRVSLVAWSLGGPRVGGYAAAHPENVDKLVLLAPAYSRRPREEPTQVPVPGAAMTKQTQADFVSNWDRQVGCENQYEPDVSETVWAEMLASDPVGATWGPVTSPRFQ